MKKKQLIKLVAISPETHETLRSIKYKTNKPYAQLISEWAKKEITKLNSH